VASRVELLLLLPGLMDELGRGCEYGFFTQANHSSRSSLAKHLFPSIIEGEQNNIGFQLAMGSNRFRSASFAFSLRFR
jgi:hypothetical protein